MGLNRTCNPHGACVGGRTTGEQRLNGRPKTKATLARVMGYVEQNDIHTPALTVVESLNFSAHLRLDRNVTKRQETKFVDNVRTHLTLEMVCGLIYSLEVVQQGAESMHAATALPSVSHSEARSHRPSRLLELKSVAVRHNIRGRPLTSGSTLLIIPQR